jgi:hypothetical protein
VTEKRDEAMHVETSLLKMVSANKNNESGIEIETEIEIEL